MTSRIWACVAEGDLHPGADRRAVRFRAHALHQDRVVAAAAVVAQQRGRAVQVVHDHVHVPVVVEVPEGAPAAEVLGQDRRPRLRGDVLEAAVAQVAIEHLRLAVLEVELLVRDLGVDVAVRDEDVRPAVVVEVEEVDAEAEVLPVDAEAGPEARVLEGRRRSCGRASSPARRSSCARCPASRRRRSRPRRRPFPRGRPPPPSKAQPAGTRDLAEGPVVVVAIEEARRGVAGHVDVGPAVVVEVRRPPRPCRRSPWAASCCRTKTMEEGPRGRAIPDALRDVGERAVALVAVEHVRAPGESQRPAGDGDVVVAAVGGLAGPRRGLGVEVHVAGHEEVEVAVAVVVEEAAAGAPAARASPRPRLSRTRP